VFIVVKTTIRIRRRFISISGIVLLIVLPAVAILTLTTAINARVSADEAGVSEFPIGNAEIRNDKDAVYFRLRAPKKNRTEYGQFRYVRETGKWESLGTVAGYDQPIPTASGPVPPENFFYPRNGYQEVNLAGLTYKIECLNNKATISIKGGSGPDEYYSSPELSLGAGNRIFRFRYLTSSRLWFDMLIEDKGVIHSAGIGNFDLRSKTISLIGPNEMEPDHGKPVIVSEMSGNGDNVWIGLAYCNEPTCLENGIVLRIGPDGRIARRWYSGEKGLPEGAVIRVMPDGDSLWVVTVKGVALINRDFIRRFQISRNAAIAEGGKFGFKQELTPLAVTPEFATSTARIVEINGNHFQLKTKAPKALWVSEEENRGSYADATTTIKLSPGKTVAFRQSADPKSAAAKLTPGQQDKIILKVSERQTGWLRVELPDFFWYTPESVRLSVEEVGQFPANNFLPGGEDEKRN
jgi:hypothetical protein